MSRLSGANAVVPAPRGSDSHTAARQTVVAATVTTPNPEKCIEAYALIAAIHANRRFRFPKAAFVRAHKVSKSSPIQASCRIMNGQPTKSIMSG